MSTQTKPLSSKKAKAQHFLKTQRINKMKILLGKIRRAQLGADRESRVEYRVMEKNLIEEIQKEQRELESFIKQHNHLLN